MTPATRSFIKSELRWLTSYCPVSFLELLGFVFLLFLFFPQELSDAGSAKPVRRPLWGLLATAAGDDAGTEASSAQPSMLGLTVVKPADGAPLPTGPKTEAGDSHVGTRHLDSSGAAESGLHRSDEQDGRSLDGLDGDSAAGGGPAREGGGVAAVLPYDVPNTAEGGAARERPPQGPAGAQGPQSAAASDSHREQGVSVAAELSEKSFPEAQVLNAGAAQGTTGGAAPAAQDEAGADTREAAAARAVAKMRAMEPGARSAEEPAPSRELHSREYSAVNGLSAGGSARVPIAHTRSYSAAGPGSVQGMGSSGYSTPRGVLQLAGGDILRQPIVGGPLQPLGVPRQKSSDGNSTSASTSNSNGHSEAGARPGPWAQEFSGTSGSLEGQAEASGEQQASEAGAGEGPASHAREGAVQGPGHGAGEGAEAGADGRVGESEGEAEAGVGLRRTLSGENMDANSAPQGPPLRVRVQRTLTHGAEGRPAQEQWLGEELGKAMGIPWLEGPGREEEAGEEGVGEGEGELEEERWSTVQLNTPDGLVPIQCSKDADGALLVRFEGDLDPDGPLGGASSVARHTLHDRVQFSTVH